jgi:uncharacterized SAM-dependent methyltransferase
MKYFTNSELAKIYQVSLSTIWRWIQAARQGKNDLELVDADGKAHIANTSANLEIVRALVASGRKRRNNLGFKTLSPEAQFYKLYTPAQVYDICTSIEIDREIPLKYGYFDGGASYWDSYATRLLNEKSPNSLKSTLKLFRLSRDYLADLLRDVNSVNVVDIGVGNALPARPVLEWLLQEGKLGRYVAVDVSADILRIARQNTKRWFGSKVPFEEYQLDFSHERFANILAEDYVTRGSKSALNLVLFVGGTLLNFREPDQVLKIVRDSLGVDDILIHEQKLDTEESRRYFDFSVDASSALAPNQRFILDLLGIEDSLYDVEMGYDDSIAQRFIRVRLKVAISIEFEFEDGERVIELKKGDSILVWRAWHQSGMQATDIIDRCGFHVLQASETSDHEYLMTISQRKRVTS